MTPPDKKTATPTADAGNSGKAGGATTQQSDTSTATATGIEPGGLYRLTPPDGAAWQLAEWVEKVVTLDTAKDRIVVASKMGVYVFAPGQNAALGDYSRAPASLASYQSEALHRIFMHGADMATALGRSLDTLDGWFPQVAEKTIEQLVISSEQASFLSILPDQEKWPQTGNIYLVTKDRLGYVDPLPAPVEDGEVAADPDGTPQTESWAEAKLKALRDALAKLSQADAKSRPPDGSMPPPESESYSLPDAVYKYGQHKGTPDEKWWITVWVGRAQQTIPINPGETHEQLTGRVRQAAKGIRTARDPRNSTDVTGTKKHPAPKGTELEITDPGRIELPEGVTTDPTGGLTVTDPAYPAQLISHGPEGSQGNTQYEHTVLGASVNFTMDLDFKAGTSNIWQELGAAFQIIDYRWEMIDLTGMDLSQVKGKLSGPTSADLKAQISALKAAAASEPDETLKQQKLEQVTDLETKLKEVNPETDSGIVRDLVRSNANMWDDTKKDLANLGSNGSILGDFATLAVSDIVRMGGSVIKAGISSVSQASSDSRLAFKKKGLWLIRCFAQPVITQDDVDRIKAKGHRPIVRAPSVALLPVMVSPINERATEVNNAELTQIAALEQQLDAPPFPFGKEDVQTQLDELRAGLNETNEESIKRQKTKVTAERDKITAWNDLQSRMVEISLRPANLRIWKSMLDLRNMTLDEYSKSLDATEKKLDEALARVTTGFAIEGVKGTMYRPRITLVSELDGGAYPLMANLAETKDSKPGARQWRLIDVTMADHQQKYDGSGATHQDAIRKALQEFAEKNEYGRGTIAVRLPVDRIKSELTETVSVPPLLVSAPGDEDRAWERLKNLAVAIELAGLVVSGPAGIALAVTGGIIGGAVAVHNMQRRASGDRLRLDDFETAMDILAVVGAFVGAASTALKGVQSAAEAGAMVRMATRAEKGVKALHVLGIGMLAGQVVLIPYSTYHQLEKIQQAEDDERAALGDKYDAAKFRAQRLETWLHAVKSAVVTTRMIQLGVDPEAGWNPFKDSVPAAKTTAPTAAELRAKPAAEGLPPDLKAQGVKVEYDPALDMVDGRKTPTNTTQVEWDPDFRGGVTAVRIKVGSLANANDVALHAETARIALRYMGFQGRLLSLLGQIANKVFGDPPPFSAAWEAQLEVAKLQPIIADRVAQLRGKELDPARQEDLLTELLSLEEQLAGYQEAMARNVSDPGKGFIEAKGAAEAVSKAQQTAKDEGMQELPDGYIYRFRKGKWEIIDQFGKGKLEIIPGTKNWQVATGAKTEPFFADGTTKQTAFKALGGTDTTRDFGKWVDLVVNDLKLRTLQQLEDAIGDPGDRTYTTVRNRVKTDALSKEIVAATRDPKRLAPTDAFKDAVAAGKPHADAIRAASLAEMLRISQKLASQDRGPLGERWYQETFAPNAKRQVHVTKGDYPSLALKDSRDIDLMDVNTLREIKNWTDSFPQSVKDQLGDFILLIGSTVQVEGKPVDVNAVVISILSPKGALMNRTFVETTLLANKTKAVTFELANAHGQIKAFSLANIADLAEPGFSAWLDLPPPAAR